MKKYLLVLALLFGLPEITTYAQDVEAYNTSVLAGRPTNPMIVAGFCVLIASATLESFFSEGVEVWMMTWS